MIFTDYVPDFTFPQLVTTNTILHTEKNIDVNHDNIVDFALVEERIEYSNSHGVPIGNSWHYIRSFNQNSITTTFDNYYYYNCGSVTVGQDSLLYQVAKKYLTGDTVLSTPETSWFNSTVMADSFKYSGCWLSFLTDYLTSIDSSNFFHVNDSSYYYVLKIIVNSDTLLGYLHIKSSSLLDFACEGPTSSHIISSTNNLNVDNSPAISPNPFTNQINISTDKPFEYLIADYTGRIVLSGKTERSIATGELGSGCYLLTIKNEETFSVKKIVKQ